MVLCGTIKVHIMAMFYCASIPPVFFNLIQLASSWAKAGRIVTNALNFFQHHPSEGSVKVPLKRFRNLVNLSTQLIRNLRTQGLRVHFTHLENNVLDHHVARPCF